MKYDILSNNIDSLINYLSSEIGKEIDKDILEKLSIEKHYFVDKVNIKKKIYQSDEGDMYVVINDNVGIKIIK